jgi:hypothetical protein
MCVKHAPLCFYCRVLDCYRGFLGVRTVFFILLAAFHGRRLGTTFVCIARSVGFTLRPVIIFFTFFVFYLPLTRQTTWKDFGESLGRKALISWPDLSSLSLRRNEIKPTVRPEHTKVDISRLLRRSK